MVFFSFLQFKTIRKPEENPKKTKENPEKTKENQRKPEENQRKPEKTKRKENRRPCLAHFRSKFVKSAKIHPEAP